MASKGGTCSQLGATAVSAVPIAGNNGSHGEPQAARLTQPWHPIVLAAFALLSIGAGDTPDERRARIEAMTPAEKQQLLARQDRFERMPPAEQERLRRLDDELSRSPREDELRHVMAAYHDWLKALSPSEREQLRQLPVSARLARVVELRKKEAGRNRFRLREPDLAAVRKWVLDLARADLSDVERAEREPQSETAREGVLLWRASGWFKGRSQRQQAWTRILTEERIGALRETLSVEAQRALDERPDLDGWTGRRALVFGWLQQFFTALQESPPAFPSPEAMREQLLKFFENDLSVEDREWLMTLSREQRIQELYRKYFGAQRVPPFQPSPGQQPGPPDEQPGPPRESRGPRQRAGRRGGADALPPAEEPTGGALRAADPP